MFKGVARVIGVIFVVVLAASAADAATLKDKLGDLVVNHKRIKAAAAAAEAAKEQISVAEGAWYPDLAITGNYGYEVQVKGQGTKNTHLPPRELDLSVKQLLWDFNATNETIGIAELGLKQALSVLVATRQGIILEAVSAHAGLISAIKVLKFARESEANIKRQTELEDARVKRGSGLSTDVLQAKTQLAGAQARRVQAEGALWTARNRYRAVFGNEPDNMKDLVVPSIPADMLPMSLDDAVEVARQNNPQLKASLIASRIASRTVNQTRDVTFFPTVNATASSKYKEDVAGVIGFKGERKMMVEFTYNFDLGLTAVNTLNASRQNALSAENSFRDARNTVEEQARNAWQNLLTAKETSSFLANQAVIAEEFLRLARKERKLGKRSLIDVLSGETALINARSDATAAETQVVVASFALLGVMGQLETDAIR